MILHKTINVNQTLLFLMVLITAGLLAKFVTPLLVGVYSVLVLVCYSITKNILLSFASAGVVCFIAVYLNKNSFSTEESVEKEEVKA